MIATREGKMIAITFGEGRNVGFARRKDEKLNAHLTAETRV